MTYDGVKTENNNGTRKNTKRYVIICNSDYVSNLVNSQEVF